MHPNLNEPAFEQQNKVIGLNVSRRQWIKDFGEKVSIAAIMGRQVKANAEVDDDDTYSNPNIPPSPEEKSGLVVLRVAEVCQFQEKILRAAARGDLGEYEVSPQQIVFGTQILLRNSNVDGNMKLMIYNEIPKRSREKAIKDAVNIMNNLQFISSRAAQIQRPFKNEEMVEIADMYRVVRVQLNNLYEYLPEREKNKYTGYFNAVTEYEKKIAEGTYNPELDGILQLDYD